MDTVSDRLSTKVLSKCFNFELCGVRVKAKFHYGIGFEAGSKLVADRFEAG